MSFSSISLTMNELKGHTYRSVFLSLTFAFFNCLYGSFDLNEFTDSCFYSISLYDLPSWEFFLMGRGEEILLKVLVCSSSAPAKSFQNSMEHWSYGLFGTKLNETFFGPNPILPLSTDPATPNGLSCILWGRG